MGIIFIIIDWILVLVHSEDSVDPLDLASLTKPPDYALGSLVVDADLLARLLDAHALLVDQLDHVVSLLRTNGVVLQEHGPIFALVLHRLSGHLACQGLTLGGPGTVTFPSGSERNSCLTLCDVRVVNHLE